MFAIITTVLSEDSRRNKILIYDMVIERGVLTGLNKGAFSYCDNLTSVYYKGSENEWNQMSIDDNNIPLTDATRYYYSATKPAASGNFWHYNSDGEIETW